MTWLYIPLASALESEGSTSEPASPSLKCELFATSSGKCLLRPPSWRGWKNRAYIELLSGTTLPLSTVNHGVEKWISSLPDSHASQYPSPENAKDTKTSDGSSMTLPASLTRYDQPTSSWKTSEGLFPEDSTEFLGRWPASGTMRSGDVYKLNKLEPHTNESGGSAWPTPAASLVNDGERPKTWFARRERLKKTANNGNGAGVPLTIASVAWPTPAARDWRGANGPEHMARKRPHMDQLPNYACHASHQAQTTSSDGNESPTRLNPLFVEWLMGMPIGWTGFEPLGTELYHYKQQLHSAYLRIAQSYVKLTTTTHTEPHNESQKNRQLTPR